MSSPPSLFGRQPEPDPPTPPAPEETAAATEAVIEANNTNASVQDPASPANSDGATVVPNQPEVSPSSTITGRYLHQHYDDHDYPNTVCIDGTAYNLHAGEWAASGPCSNCQRGAGSWFHQWCAYSDAHDIPDAEAVPDPVTPDNSAAARRNVSRIRHRRPPSSPINLPGPSIVVPPVVDIHNRDDVWIGKSYFHPDMVATRARFDARSGLPDDGEPGNSNSPQLEPHVPDNAFGPPLPQVLDPRHRQGGVPPDVPPHGGGGGLNRPRIGVPNNSSRNRAVMPADLGPATGEERWVEAAARAQTATSNLSALLNGAVPDDVQQSGRSQNRPIGRDLDVVGRPPQQEPMPHYARSAFEQTLALLRQGSNNDNRVSMDLPGTARQNIAPQQARGRGLNAYNSDNNRNSNLADLLAGSVPDSSQQGNRAHNPPIGPGSGVYGPQSQRGTASLQRPNPFANAQASQPNVRGGMDSVEDIQRRVERMMLSREDRDNATEANTGRAADMGGGNQGRHGALLGLEQSMRDMNVQDHLRQTVGVQQPDYTPPVVDRSVARPVSGLRSDLKYPWSNVRDERGNDRVESLNHNPQGGPAALAPPHRGLSALNDNNPRESLPRYRASNAPETVELVRKYGSNPHHWAPGPRRTAWLNGTLEECDAKFETYHYEEDSDSKKRVEEVVKSTEKLKFGKKDSTKADKDKQGKTAPAKAGKPVSALEFQVPKQEQGDALLQKLKQKRKDKITQPKHDKQVSTNGTNLMKALEAEKVKEREQEITPGALKLRQERKIMRTTYTMDESDPVWIKQKKAIDERRAARKEKEEQEQAATAKARNEEVHKQVKANGVNQLLDELTRNLWIEESARKEKEKEYQEAREKAKVREEEQDTTAQAIKRKADESTAANVKKQNSDKDTRLLAYRIAELNTFAQQVQNKRQRLPGWIEEQGAIIHATKRIAPDTEYVLPTWPDSGEEGRSPFCPDALPPTPVPEPVRLPAGNPLVPAPLTIRRGNTGSSIVSRAHGTDNVFEIVIEAGQTLEYRDGVMILTDREGNAEILRR